MKALELYSIWAENGVPDAILKKQLLTRNIFGEIFKGKYYAGEGDHEIDTTPELVARSAHFELFQEKCVAAPATCTSCHHDESTVANEWTYGHRPNWYVCAQCETVLPCRCHNPDRNGNSEWYALPDENGKCGECGRTLTELGIARIREAEALKEAKYRTWDRVVAEHKVKEKEERRLHDESLPKTLVVRASSDEAKAMLAKLRAEWEAKFERDQPSDVA
jgi:hypothetical protein